jgi:hypothetical protein
VIHSNVTLALLFRIVKGVSVKKGPNELATDVFESEFERGVLEDGVMAAVESCRADVEALLVGDFFGRDEMVRVTRAGGSDGRIEGMIKKVAKSDFGRGRFDGLGRAGAFKHSRLGGHDGTLFYTVAKQRHRREKYVKKTSPE